MARSDVRIEGMAELSRKLLEIPAGGEKGAVRAVRRVTLDVHRSVREKLKQPGTGREYTRGNVTHVASAPGQPPASDSGRLSNSYGFDFERGGLTGIVGTNLSYAPHLEFGKRKMAPRPHLFTSYEEERPKLEPAIREEVAAELAKISRG
jgi:phage gpG-like protein